MSNDQDEKKALLTNVTDLARDAQQRLRPSRPRVYTGPPTSNQGPRRRGQKMW